MTRLVALLCIAVLLSACGSDSEKSAGGAASEQTASAPAPTQPTAPAASESKTAETAEMTEEPAAGVSGNAANGAKIFKQPSIHGLPGCVTCHSLEPGMRLVGPSLAGLATTAASRVEGMSAVDYIKQSITEPNAHVVDGFPPGMMLPGYRNNLSQQEFDDLVAYLMTLE